ncbi:MAG: sulfurtransferase complex subunit TusD [Buchnera aphidicola (Periphyllus acericola)]|uniref:sulfurtransferase complex subunit TusD n=1 Tax=Buchnera aphidicola TaxID=9 RepID=UPI0030D0DA84|nr:sulfurtransferase complex subunit TusD [Buchnera aphidicola (Periphyllus acericola)]
MIYTIIVKSSFFSKENSISALLFSKALIMKKKHFIKSIFFISDGVLNMNRFLSFTINELNLKKKWINFSKKNKVRLNVCFSAALRRGIINIKKKINYENFEGNLGIFFKISSLEKLSRDIQKSDRVIQF